MEVICLEEKAFYVLIEQVIEHLGKKHVMNPAREQWISTELAMELLNIKSKTTLQKLRNEGKIRFSQHLRRNILYDRDSITKYLDRNARDTF